MKDLTGTNFKEMEERHFEALRDSAEEEERKVQAQLDRLAYLEDNRGARSSHAKRNQAPRTQQVLIGLAILVAVRTLFSYSDIASTYVQSDTVKFR
jgi:hypothetical protein